MRPRVDRRKFLSMFAAGAVGMTVADKLGLFNDIQKWVLSPSKTIFIPPTVQVYRIAPPLPTFASIDSAWLQVDRLYAMVSTMAYAK